MSGRDRHLRLCRVLIFLVLCFIWGNSLLPANASQAISDGVQSLLEAIVQGAGKTSSNSGLLRKIAHYTEFTALGLVLHWHFQLLRKKGGHPMLWGVLTACIDETIQFFVPGRSPGLLDVGIDSCGVLTGMLLLQIGYVLHKRNQ